VQRSWCRNVFDMTDYEEMIHLFQYPKWLFDKRTNG
jgi:hypothetical protein